MDCGFPAFFNLLTHRMLPKHSRLAVLGLSGSLVVAGVLLILINLDTLRWASPRLEYFLSLVLLVGGIIFAWFFLLNRANWWQLIPSFTCLSLAAMLYMTTIDRFSPRINASVLLWGMACSFLLAYIIDSRERWWGLVMAGLMSVLGANTALSSTVVSIEELGAVTFGGLGIIFILLFLQGDKTRFWWAPIPGFVLCLYGVFAYMDTRTDDWLQDWKIWWPAVLILAGVFVVVSAYLFPRLYRFSPPVTEAAGANAGEELQHVRSTPDVLHEVEGQVPGSTVVVLRDVQHDPHSSRS